MPEPTREAIDALTKALADKGKIIEAGWMSYRLLVIPPDAPPIQVSESRKAFMAGAQHTWASLLTMLDEDAEPTSGDLRRMDLIARELAVFGQELEREARGWPISP